MFNDFLLWNLSYIPSVNHRKWNPNQDAPQFDWNFNPLQKRPQSGAQVCCGWRRSQHVTHADVRAHAFRRISRQQFRLQIIARLFIF